MTLIINVLSAWLALILASLLGIIYLLRILNKGKNKNRLISTINKKLRNSHKVMGIAFVVIACIHGFFSSTAIFSFNFGSLCIITGIILGLTYYLRKLFPKKIKWIVPHRGLTIILILFLGLHLGEIGGIMGPESFLIGSQRELENSVAKLYGSSKDLSPDQFSDPVENLNLSKQAKDLNQNNALVEKTNLFLGNIDLTDGTYTGLAEGYGPELTVSITVLNNELTDIQVVSHNENNEKYYSKAIDAIPSEMIAKQTILVDTISGATLTSNGIIKAVLNGLEPAVISGTLAPF